MMDTDQVLTWGFQKMALNLVRNLKINPQGYILPVFVQLGAGIHSFVFPAYILKGFGTPISLSTDAVIQVR